MSTNLILLLLGLCSVSRSQLIGPNGQLCEDPTDPDDSPPFYCPIVGGVFQGRSGDEIECSENFDCCLCSSIECGAADGSSFCDKFVVNGDSGAFGVSDITIYGDCDDGASIECSGDDSCRNSQIRTAECVSEIICGGDRSCRGANFTASCVVDDRCELECGGEQACNEGTFVVANTEGLKCSDDGACGFGTFALLSNDGGKIDCGGLGACFGANIQVTQIEDVVCNGNVACSDVDLLLVNPKGGVDIECNGDAVCQGLEMDIVLSADTTDGDLELGNIFCDGDEACREAEIVLQNNNCAESATFEKLDCSDEDACRLLSIESTGCGSFTIEECDCGEENQGCVDARGLAAVCLNIAATEEPTTPAPAPEVLSCSNPEVGPFFGEVGPASFSGVFDVEINVEGQYTFIGTYSPGCSGINSGNSSLTLIDSEGTQIDQTFGTPITAQLDDGTYALNVFVIASAGQTCSFTLSLVCPVTTPSPTAAPVTTLSPTPAPVTVTLTPATTSDSSDSSDSDSDSDSDSSDSDSDSDSSASLSVSDSDSSSSSNSTSSDSSDSVSSDSSDNSDDDSTTMAPATTSSGSSDSDSSDSDDVASTTNAPATTADGDNDSDSNSDSSDSDSDDESTTAAPNAPSTTTDDDIDVNSSDSDSDSSDSSSEVFNATESASDSESSDGVNDVMPLLSANILNALTASNDDSDSEVINATESASNSNSDSDSSDSDSSDSDSDSGDMSTTVLDDADSDDGAASFARAIGSESSAASGLLGTEEEADVEHVMVSLSKETLMNLWALCALVMAVNVALCVWCHCKKKAQNKQRFVEDQYVSDVNNV